MNSNHPPLRAVMVSVDYTDLLSITLPYNRHHFESVLIVTNKRDIAGLLPLAEKYNCELFETELFYAYGATFNKWLALESGLDYLGRYGWLCLMDADILWPTDIGTALYNTEVGYLYTPMRRMYNKDLRVIPLENDWYRYPIHRNVNEWAGYSQIFHADDKVLGQPPWHQIDWKHAGGADSFFQRKWNVAHKVRPAFEVLHLGPAGANWCGRVSHYVDGTVPDKARERREELEGYWAGRRGKDESTRFDHEKIHE